jgi:hypothetical protein
MPGDFKRESISKKLNKALYNGLERTTTKFYFSEILRKKIALFVYGEYAKWGKSIDIKHISVNYRTT